jgi:hypothetical protein
LTSPDLPATVLGSGGRRNPGLRARVALVVVVFVATAAAVAGAVQLVWHIRLFGGRATFPLDLEWMEGGMLVHAQRLASGHSLYVRPSLEFIPFLYTPLYPALLATLSWVLPFGYFLGRAVSLLSFAATLTIVGLIAVRQASPRLSRLLGIFVAVAVAGGVTAGFEFTGGFYDLARSDSLLLLCETAALALAFAGTSRASAAAAGVAMTAAFLTKQTGPIVGVGIGLGLLVTSWRRALIYGVVSAVLMGLGLLYLVQSSHGWFWTYIFKLHQSHPFRPDTLTTSPPYMWRHCWPTWIALCLATAGLALAGRLRRTDAILWGGALGGFVSAVLGFATMWAWFNAFIPAVTFPAFAAAILAARLLAHVAETRLIGTSAFAAACVLALGLQSYHAGKPLVATRMPAPADRAAAARFLERLRALPGDGFIPFHPYYGALAGRRTFVHRIGVMDVESALGRPEGLDRAIAEQRFPWIILDYKSQRGEWPGLEARYRVVHIFQEGVDAARVFSGADTSPRWLLVPARDPPPLPPGGSRLADFETPIWRGWSVDGMAFGPGPAAARDGLFGRFAADSGQRGPSGQGTLRSAPLTVGRPHLRFTLAGPADPGLRVLLVAGAETARTANPSGAVAAVEWDVRDLIGRQVVILIEDRSATASLAVDEIVAY